MHRANSSSDDGANVDVDAIAIVVGRSYPD